MTVIPLELTRPRRITLKIFDESKSEIATLVDDVLPAGLHRFTWDHRTAPNGGTYWARLMMGGQTLTRQISVD